MQLCWSNTGQGIKAARGGKEVDCSCTLDCIETLGKMWYSTAWREVMRIGKCALSSFTAAGKTHTYWRMGGGKAQPCAGSLGWPDLGTSADLSVALCSIQEEGRRAGKHREDHDQHFLPSEKEKDLKKNHAPKKKNGFCIYHHGDKARLSN